MLKWKDGERTKNKVLAFIHSIERKSGEILVLRCLSSARTQIHLSHHIREEHEEGNSSLEHDLECDS
jgi:hypothetical protein